MEKALEIICDNIKVLRERKKLTQPKLAELAKVNLKTIQRVEQKHGVPSWSSICLIAEALQISPFKLAEALPTPKK